MPYHQVDSSNWILSISWLTNSNLLGPSQYKDQPSMYRLPIKSINIKIIGKPYLCGPDETSLITRFMGPIWSRQDPCGHHVGPMNFAIWDCNFIHKHQNAVCHVCSCQKAHIFNAENYDYITVIRHAQHSLSSHRKLGCLLRGLFRLTTMNTWKLRNSDPLWGESHSPSLVITQTSIR